MHSEKKGFIRDSKESCNRLTCGESEVLPKNINFLQSQPSQTLISSNRSPNPKRHRSNFSLTEDQSMIIKNAKKPSGSFSRAPSLQSHQSGEAIIENQSLNDIQNRNIHISKSSSSSFYHEKETMNRNFQNKSSLSNVPLDSTHGKVSPNKAAQIIFSIPKTVLLSSDDDNNDVYNDFNYQSQGDNGQLEDGIRDENSTGAYSSIESDSLSSTSLYDHKSLYEIANSDSSSQTGCYSSRNSDHQIYIDPDEAETPPSRSTEIIELFDDDEHQDFPNLMQSNSRDIEDTDSDSSHVNTLRYSSDVISIVDSEEEDQEIVGSDTSISSLDEYINMDFSDQSEFAENDGIISHLAIFFNQPNFRSRLRVINFPYPIMGDYMDDREIDSMQYEDLLRLTENDHQTLFTRKKPLPISFYSQPENESGSCGGSCSICISNYCEGEEVASLTPCNHMFHHECITSWISRSNTCPVCREYIQ